MPLFRRVTYLERDGKRDTGNLPSRVFRVFPLQNKTLQRLSMRYMSSRTHGRQSQKGQFFIRLHAAVM